jgi:hypothetical protein
MSSMAASFGHAQDVEYINYEDAIGLIHNVHVYIVDNVSGGCWTNLNAVENRVTAKLEQAGVRTYNERLAFLNGVSVQLYIEPTGYRTNSGLCVGSLAYSIGANASQTIGDVESTGTTWSVSRMSTIYQNGVTFSGPNNFNSDILEAVDSYTDELIGKIHKGRRAEAVRNLLSTFPVLISEPMTHAEFERIVQRVVEEGN